MFSRVHMLNNPTEHGVARMRNSVANVSKSMQDFLTSSKKPVIPTTPAPQFLPPSLLRSKLESYETLAPPTAPMSEDGSQDGDQDGSDAQSTLSGIHTLVESLDLKLTRLSPNASFKGETRAQVPDTPPSKPRDDSHTQSKTPSSDGKTAPLPAPLHIIEAFAAQDEVVGSKPKLSNPTWGVSELGVDENENHVSAGSLLKNETDADVIPESRSSAIQQYSSERLNLGKVRSPIAGLWLESVPKGPIVRLCRCRSADPESVNCGHNSADDTYKQCGIDDQTGEWLPPIDYPAETLKHQDPGPCRDEKDIGWRQNNMTTALQIVREMKARQRLADRCRAKVVLRPTPVVEEVARPTARCSIRPATPDDFDAIARIINLEIQDERRPRVLESQAVQARDIRLIYEDCRQNSRPFVVAMSAEDGLLDRAKWPKDADEEYQEFVAYRMAKRPKATVLGFAFVTDSRQGFLGSPCPGSRFSGQIRLMVHPNHRKKLHGTALMDRILRSISIYHQSVVDYKWDCAEPAGIYEELATKNRRSYTRVYLETIFAGGSDPDLPWMTSLMEKFEFKKAACFEQAVRSDCGGDSEWLDLVVWELEARPVNEINNDNSRQLTTYRP
ncbi:hypothetical protein G7046_g7281 [Stylonectria norvegica]|nr:hypothetical protein G7046_g7281 [Stylonectria norvegica]